MLKYFRMCNVKISQFKKLLSGRKEEDFDISKRIWLTEQPLASLDCLPGPSTPDDPPMTTSTNDEDLLEGSQAITDSGLYTAEPTLTCSQVSVSSNYSPAKKVIEKAMFTEGFERTGANNRAGKFFFLALLLCKMDLITQYFKMKILKRSYFEKYAG